MGGGFSFPWPRWKWKKLFTFDDNGPSIILILPNSSDIAMHGFPTEPIFSFSDTFQN